MASYDIKIPYVEIRDLNTRKILGIIEGATLFFEYAFREVGEFEIYCKADVNSINLLKVDRLVTLPNSVEDNEDGVWIIETVQKINDTVGGRSIIAKGTEAKSILNRRIIKGTVTLTAKESYKNRGEECIAEGNVLISNANALKNGGVYKNETITGGAQDIEDGLAIVENGKNRIPEILNEMNIILTASSQVLLEKGNALIEEGRDLIDKGNMWDIVANSSYRTEGQIRIDQGQTLINQAVLESVQTHINDSQAWIDEGQKQISEQEAQKHFDSIAIAQSLIDEGKNGILRIVKTTEIQAEIDNISSGQRMLNDIVDDYHEYKFYDDDAYRTAQSIIDIAQSRINNYIENVTFLDEGHDSIDIGQDSIDEGYYKLEQAAELERAGQNLVEKGNELVAYAEQLKAEGIPDKHGNLVSELRSKIFLPNVSAPRMVNADGKNVVDTNRKLDIIFDETPVNIYEDFKHQTSWTNVYEYTEALYASYYSLGAKMRIDKENKTLVYSIYKAKDKSKIVFSQVHDNLLSSEYLVSDANWKTHMFVMGEAKEEGANRPVVEIADEYTGFNRREAFVDASDISWESETEVVTDTVITTEPVDLTPEEYTNALLKRGVAVKASEYKKEEILTGEIDVTNHRYKFGVDYFLGDIITIHDKFENVKELKRVVKFTRVQDESGYKEYFDNEEIEEGDVYVE